MCSVHLSQSEPACNSPPFEGLPRNYFGALLVDPPWYFQTWSKNGRGRCADRHYVTPDDPRYLPTLPIGSLAAPNCVLFLWWTWAHLPLALLLIDLWGFTYKTCAFCWAKPQIGLGYWTRSKPSLVCSLRAASRSGCTPTCGKASWRRAASIPASLMKSMRA